MPQQTLDLIRAGVDALNRRDVDAMLATLDPDVELEPLRAVLEGSVYRGHEGLREWLDDMDEDWQDFHFEIADLRPLAPDRVLLVGRVRARARASGVELDDTAAWVCDVRDGKVARVHFYSDAKSALEAVREMGA
jgi:ketosteroid isomerase-like protein